MNAKTRWLDTWRARWVGIKRAGELGLSGLLLAVGVVLFVTLLPELPGMVWDALTGDEEVTRTLFICAVGIAVCVLQWRWRMALYPQLRRNAAKEKTL
ncbi:MAG: hypothetical protein VYB20_11075 [Pseudomonadota bacterium]|uniref:hypothetical protein n=1 Tax=Halomonas sp. PR-M31 TaxID=1471202 RepID=UPI000651774E|nr:hypothetical protein [Halomonas sp. PR-M31]MEC8937729.1 hypothetical protein [Pseudomonadota bacterium]